AGDLVELPGGEQPRGRPVVLAQLREQDRADGHVDADAQRVRAADDLEVALLGEPLHQPAVLREHPGVVDADAVADEAGQRAPEAGPEPEAPDGPGDGVLLLSDRKSTRLN